MRLRTGTRAIGDDATTKPPLYGDEAKTLDQWKGQISKGQEISLDGQTWELYDRGLEVSGYHHNVGYDFLSLRPALYAAGAGEVRFRNFRYRALD